MNKKLFSNGMITKTYDQWLKALGQTSLTYQISTGRLKEVKV